MFLGYKKNKITTQRFLCNDFVFMNLIERIRPTHKHKILHIFKNKILLKFLNEHNNALAILK